MSESAPLINFSNTEQVFHTEVWNAEALPRYYWPQMQSIHHDSLIRNLDHRHLDQAAEFVHLGDVDQYRHGRVDPNAIVGEQLKDYQLFRRPTVALTFDHFDQLVGAVLTADNSSSAITRLPMGINAPDLLDTIRETEMKLKMVLPPWFDLGPFAHKRYVHLREAYIKPYSQEAPIVEPGTAVVSAIALLGVYRSLMFRNKRQIVAGYEYPDELIDRDMVNLHSALHMTPTGEPEPTEEGVMQLRVVRGNKDITDGIIENEKMAELIRRSSVIRRTAA
ncbi:MAG TPA: hypothetical protein VIH90_05955 [Candidatus Saccharimonadales bacterium]